MSVQKHVQVTPHSFVLHYIIEKQINKRTQIPICICYSPSHLYATFKPINWQIIMMNELYHRDLYGRHFM